MSLLSFNLDSYEQSILAFFLLIIPAGLYAIGIYEDKKYDKVFGAGLLLHAFSIIQRWGYTGLIPLSEKHDNISLTAFIMAALYWNLKRQGKVKNLAPYAITLISAAILVSIGFRTMDSITPFMRSPWFYLHVTFYFTSYAWFGISAALSAQYIISGDSSQEALAYRLASTGWILLSTSLLFGSVWFYLAYGTYWLWTSKELWISIMWLYYGLYLHARLINRLRGKAVAVLGLIGFMLALFTYFGVGTVIKSPPTQF